ncbi:MAG: 16S rRNA (cytosine(1402)-N(4))-methyltransferase RsmH [Alphaproteobacteria bacterium]|nr:16S rRNA (cytosine(1402)-N(4))-methyltransferase RsmH [Alphaproteobacteria bacterium]MDP6517329.1 16S rRNA (cytosine(1402)-N(4))-methyltransferase RsmH [Alphaproteobacteria bacterium]
MTDANPSRRVGHVPVLLTETLAALGPQDHALYLDCTFGRGGYTEALLDSARCTVCGVDRDPAAIARGAALVDAFPGRLTLIEGRFADLEDLLSARGIGVVDGGIVFDLGVSSDQIDDPGRGFSFRRDGPLDMRMGADGPSAADLVNGAGEAELADIIAKYGGERRARRVARAIVAARAKRAILGTGRLAAVIRAVVPQAADGIDPATRTFQALRIYVNDELEELARGLAAAERRLAAGARLAVVSFHSLEDRLVKRFLRERAGAAPRPHRHRPAPQSAARAPSFRLLHKRPIRPGTVEIAGNPRARSARLRAAERTAGAPWPAPDDPRAAA